MNRCNFPTHHVCGPISFTKARTFALTKIQQKGAIVTFSKLDKRYKIKQTSIKIDYVAQA